MARKHFDRTCKTCGATFGSTGFTVNCPACRVKAAPTPKPTATGPRVCRCGKTVLSNGVTCPRECDR